MALTFPLVGTACSANDSGRATATSTAPATDAPTATSTAPATDATATTTGASSVPTLPNGVQLASLDFFDLMETSGEVLGPELGYELSDRLAPPEQVPGLIVMQCFASGDAPAIVNGAVTLWAHPEGAFLFLSAYGVESGEEAERAMDGFEAAAATCEERHPSGEVLAHLDNSAYLDPSFPTADRTVAVRLTSAAGDLLIDRVFVASGPVIFEAIVVGGDGGILDAAEMVDLAASQVQRFLTGLESWN